MKRDEFTREDFLPGALKRIEEELEATGRLRWPRCTVARPDLQLLVEELYQLRRRSCRSPKGISEALNSGDGSYKP